MRVMSELFAKIVERAGLPRLIARSAIQRALARAELTPSTVTPNNLRGALTPLGTTLRVYLDEADAAARLDAIEALCTPPAPRA